MLHIYWGMGKGKSSILNGSAIRAKGANLRVGFYRFLKGRISSENKILNMIGIKVHLFHNSKKFVIEMNSQEKILTKKLVLKAIDKIKKDKNKFDVIFIDEILDLASPSVNLVSEKDLFDLIQILEPTKREIMISGHIELKTIFKIADLITYLEPQKHYFNNRIFARLGIEY